MAELMQPNGDEWDMAKINNLFLPFERERITNIRISPNESNDLWYWGMENDGLYTGAEVDPEKIIKRVREVACEDAEWRAVAVNDRVEMGRREGEGEGGINGWKPAPDGFVKVNVDAGAKEGEGVSMGEVCRNRSGEVVWGMAVVREQSWDPHNAEAVVVLDGLQEAVEHGI
ncbi:uncharacterized protein LOC141595716 [Silene latifolia]|uniref:uncharacterized protein LOC141595716 n=1 Tax=Silene latifolia TaxID=37657 RepID=UPI003D76EB25